MNDVQSAIVGSLLLLVIAAFCAMLGRRFKPMDAAKLREQHLREAQRDELLHLKAVEDHSAAAAAIRARINRLEKNDATAQRNA